jgi:hypothetical protein
LSRIGNVSHKGFTTGVLPMRRHEIKDEDWDRIKDF